MKTRKFLQAIEIITIIIILFIIQYWSFNTLFKNIPIHLRDCWDVTISMIINATQCAIILTLSGFIISKGINKD